MDSFVIIIENVVDDRINTCLIVYCYFTNIFVLYYAYSCIKPNLGKFVATYCAIIVVYLLYVGVFSLTMMLLRLYY